ncbi:porin family protein [Tropicimonas marinistellae]|uniref:porin family protein n=1 Tax=Tropicimonas marinistellae TaxID=1739787 RepID=UPI000830720C|nr:porin family protein [Tropicimonas marinistellae]
MLKKHFAALVLLLGILGAPATAIGDALTERGIDPSAIELMVSELSTDLSYTRFAEIEVNTESEIYKDRLLIEFDPSTPAGIDLVLRFEDAAPTTASPRRFRSVLENRMRLQHQIRTLQIGYDPDTVAVESTNGDKAVIRFRYTPFALPQDIAWMRFLQGRIWVDGDRVERILLELDDGRAFLHDGTRVTDYTMDVRFSRAANGTDVIQDTVNTIVARDLFLGVVPGGGRFVTTTRSTAISYTDADGNDVTPRAAAIPAGVDLGAFDTPVRVNIDRTFPIWGRQARAAGYEFPKPFGISLMYTDLSTMLDFTSFEINGERALIEAIFDPNGSGIDIDTNMPQIRVDWFPVPFLNLMALFGELDARGDLKIRTTGLGQLVGLPDVIDAKIDIDSFVYGGGATLGAGWRNYFASVTGTAMTTVTEDAGTESTAYTITPQVGYYFPRHRLRLMVGAEWLKLENEMVGNISLPDGDDLDFRIGLEHEEWSARAGLYKQFGNNMELTLTGTYGDTRKGVTAMLGYRF